MSDPTHTLTPMEEDRKNRPAAVIEIEDSDEYTERLDLQLTARESLEIRARDGARPVIRLLDYRANRADALHVGGMSDSRFTLDGICIVGRGLVIEGDIGDDATDTGGKSAPEPGHRSGMCEVRIRDCTLVPGWGLHTDCNPRSPDDPSIEMINTDVGLVMNEVLSEPSRFQYQRHSKSRSLSTSPTPFWTRPPTTERQWNLQEVAACLRPAHRPTLYGLWIDQYPRHRPGREQPLLRCGHSRTTAGGLRPVQLRALRIQNTAPVPMSAGWGHRGAGSRCGRRPASAGGAPVRLHAVRRADIRAVVARLRAGDHSRRRRRVRDGRVPRPLQSAARSPASQATG